jgi:hypothetical protein
MWPPSLIAVAAAMGWFLVFMALQLGSLRAGFGGARSLLLPYAASTAGMLLTLIAILVAHEAHVLSIALALAMSLLTSACLFVLYVPAVYTVLTSLSVQTIIALHRSSGRLPEVELYGHFAGPAMFEGRLQTLVESGYLARHEGRYRTTSRGLAIAGPFAALKTFWRLGPGG